MIKNELDCEVPVTKSMEIEVNQIKQFLEEFKLWEDSMDIKINIEEFKKLRDDTDRLRGEYASFYAQVLVDNNIDST